MDTPRFQRQIENFNCENCSCEVIGNGYTNHCPNCLFSKHVDINPGDRACTCHGLMRPVSVTRKHAEYVITQRCDICACTKQIRAAQDDNFEALLKLARENS